jgi:hypothetical protein
MDSGGDSKVLQYRRIYGTHLGFGLGLGFRVRFRVPLG